MRRATGVATAALLTIGGVARAESMVPMNYVDDFGAKSASFVSEGPAMSIDSADRELVLGVNGPSAAVVAPSSASLTSVSTPSPDREYIASVNGASGDGFQQARSTTEIATAVAEAWQNPRPRGSGGN